MQKHIVLFAFYDILNKNIARFELLFVLLQIKLFIMDIKARIEEVIAQRGLTKREVSERMGKFNQAFNSLITNPKWDTIEHVAKAIGITTEELLFGNDVLSTKSLKNGDNVTKNSKEDSAQSFGVIICPYCRKGIKLTLIKE